MMGKEEYITVKKDQVIMQCVDHRTALMMAERMKAIFTNKFVQKKLMKAMRKLK